MTVNRRSTMAADAARALLLLLLFLLAIQRPSLPLLGFTAFPADFIYLVLLLPLGAALILRQAAIPRHKLYLFIAIYVGGLALSLIATPDLRRSTIKLVTQLYLVSLAVIPAMLITTERHMRAALSSWLAGTAVLVLLCVASVIAFYVDRGSALLDYTLNIYGTLMPGPYPRLKLAFEYANQLCNYLSISLVMLLAMRHLQWIGTTLFRLLLAGILFASAFTISPGLGGIFLVGGLWIWLVQNRTGSAGKLALAAGIAAAVLFVLAATVTPFLHPTAPYLIRVPFTDIIVAPAVRLMTWTDALRTFLAHPILGKGIGMDSVHVTFVIPTGEPQGLTDAHNGYLNIAAQAGLIGLAGFLLLLAAIVRTTRPFRLAPDRSNSVRLALGLAVLGALAYQGFTGSFEDARHLWLAIGLLIAADRIERHSSPDFGVAGRARS
jgi:putative inorganic carbon (hco3(-)) transporter